MTDIVERLRNRAKFNTAEDPYHLLEEAADEIERLRSGDHHIATVVRDLVKAKAEVERLREENNKLRLDGAVK
jgi:RNA polymerase-interacting CarD/CdnL/TRCF family regulator